MTPALTAHPLRRADGSYAYSDNLYTILAGVTGPIEVQRRDELPEEAFVEVHVRPSAGVGGPAERWLESTLAAVLKSILLVQLHPRTLIQVSLQITREPARALRGGVRDIALLPPLVNAAVLGLVDAGLPLDTVASAVLGVVGRDGAVLLAPEEKELEACRSAHALAYDLHGDCLLDVEFGAFEAETWRDLRELARERCLAAVAPIGEDVVMEDDGAGEKPWLRSALQERVREANVWREGC